jgi:hypothetical protein
VALSWVRLDVAFPRNHKVLALAAHREYQAITVYVCGLAYSGEQGTDGFIPREALPLLHGRTRDADALCRERLWLPEAGGWMVNGWEEFQPSTEEMKQRSVRARAAAMARWHRDDER